MTNKIYFENMPEAGKHKKATPLEMLKFIIKNSIEEEEMRKHIKITNIKKGNNK